ncbi:MAG: arginine deiminase-related protein [Dehalococcoidia bacterium]
MTQHVLMCDPRHYRIAYEINPWMRRSNAVVHATAGEQWRALHDVLVDLGVRVELVEQRAEVPDMTFTANAGVVVGRRFIPANFRFAERQAETPHFERWFKEHGYEVVRVHAPHFWEGEGDVLTAGGRVFAGYRFRTEFRALDHLDEMLQAETVRLELRDPRFYHLDTCLFPIDARRALYFPGAFTDASCARLAATFADLVEIPEVEATRFACNALLVDGTAVLNTGCDATVAALEARGLACRTTPTDEFIKAGGSVKCLVLTLDTFAVPPSR